MSHPSSDPLAAVDALLAAVDDGHVLPAPAERVRLREAAGLTQAAVAQALGIRVPSIQAWEEGRAEPRAERLQAYRRLLDGLAQRYPAPQPASPQVSPPALPPVSSRDSPPSLSPVSRLAIPSDLVPGQPQTDPAPQPLTSHPTTPQSPALEPSGPAAGAAASRQARPTPTSSTFAPRHARPTPAPDTPRDERFANGPLAVIDLAGNGQVVAYCVGGLVLDVPAKSLPALVEWTLTEACLGAGRLNGSGRDADPLLALTVSALERYGLPAELSDAERLAGRLPAGHKTLKQLEKADWQLTRRGLGPWARIYRPAQGDRRACVQLCIPSWNALDPRSWGHAADLPPAELARVLGLYAARVLTPRGSTAVTGLELMTALSPPTRASVPDGSGRRHSEHRPGSLGTQPLDPAPCEAPDGHPVLAHLPRFHVRDAGERLVEEAYDWARELTDDECMQRHLVGIDVNMAFAAAANGAVVGLAQPPIHLVNPAFDPRTPGSWLVDLSHIDLSRVLVGKQQARLHGELLPSPFTPTGERPTGPAWYATPTVAYAIELGYDIAPLQAWVRPESGRYLDDWYKRLRNAYVATMDDLGVGEKLGPAPYLAALDGCKMRDPEAAIVLDAIKATVKGGIGKLQERARGGGWRPGDAWPALARPTWRPDIRATVISRARINMHRKMIALAAATGRYPVAVLSDCAVYAADGPSPLDVLPYGADGRTVPGSFRIGISPGMVKHEGTQTTLWAEQLREQTQAPLLNLARYIKTGDTHTADTGE
ncbi:telomere-associated protein Tap [Streptomyces sp. NPDC127103]|uniref:telomere-associated protein Tap n=1 Tax=Streptomyces sp. NPDC127103 TaxID=3347139 RepID=UPI0036635599